MKRQLILGLILLLLVAAAAGVYVLVDQIQQKQQQQAMEEAVAMQLTDYFQTNSVTKLELHTPEQDYTIEIDDTTNNWAVTNIEDMQINTSYIATLCSYGSGLSAYEDLGPVDSETRARYGLDDPISITYYVDQTTYTIYLGNQTTTGEYFYMMKDGSDHVYLVDANTAGYLMVTETQLRYRYVVKDSTSDFCQLRLERDSKVIYGMTVTEDGWSMTEPFELPISLDNSKISSLLITLQELEVDEFGDAGITEADYATYGFDQPGYVLEFAQEDGSEVTLLFQDYDPMVTSYVDCLHVQTGEILIFNSSYLTFLQAETDDYLVDTLYKPGIESVTEMTITYQGSFNDQTLDIASTFTVDYTNGSYHCDGDDFSDNEEAVTAFQEFFTVATNLRYEKLIQDEDLIQDAESPAYDPDKVALQLTYTLLDDSVHTVELIPYTDNTYWAYIDGESAHVTVRQRNLSNNDYLLDRYTTLMEILATAES